MHLPRILAEDLKLMHKTLEHCCSIWIWKYIDDQNRNSNTNNRDRLVGRLANKTHQTEKQDLSTPRLFQL